MQLATEKTARLSAAACSNADALEKVEAPKGATCY